MNSKSTVIILSLAVIGAILAALIGCGVLPSGPDKKGDSEPTLSFTAQIEMITGPETCGVLPGHAYNLEITTDCERGRLDGYDLCIAYDPNILTPILLIPGEYNQSAGWNHFSYEITHDTVGVNDSIIGFIKITASTDSLHDIVQSSTDDSLPSSLAIIRFYVTQDRSYECTHTPVRFFRQDCDDNRFYTLDGDTVSNCHTIFDAEMEGMNDSRLTDSGWHALVNGDLEDIPSILPVVFIDGGVDIYCCGCGPSGRGDINCNELANEIADAVMFTNFFVNGLAAFVDHIECSISASDVNADGLTLTPADLDYLIRVIIGEAIPYDRLQPGRRLEISTRENGDGLTVGYNTEYTAGTVWLIFELNGEIETPELIDDAADMDLKYSVNEDTLRVLIYHIGSNSIPAGRSDLLRIPYSGSLNLIEAQAGDYDGALMNVSIGDPVIK